VWGPAEEEEVAPAPLDVQASITSSYATRSFPTQEAFYWDPAREVIAVAAVRSGKTRGGAEKVATRIFKDMVGALAVDEHAAEWAPRGKKPMVGTDKPRATYWVVAPSYDLAKLAWADLRSALNAIQPLIMHETDGVLWLYSGILIERKTGADEAQLQGAALSGAWLDEVCTTPYASYLQVRNRLSDHEGWLVMTGSPRPDSWVKPEIWDNAASPVSKHHWTTEENPWFPRAELERARLTLPDAWYRRDFKASWDTFIGLVYGEYRDDVHLVDPSEVPNDLECWGGQDWGSAAAGALIVGGRSRGTNRLYVADEVYTDRLVIVANGQGDSWVRRAVSMHAQYRFKAIYCDVSKGDDGRFQYVKAGLPAVTAAKGPGSILDGIKVMARVLHPSEASPPRLMISKKCVNFIREIKAYTWAVNSAGQPQDRVNPTCSDHALDAGRMWLQGAFSKADLDAPFKGDGRTPPVEGWTRGDYQDYAKRQLALRKRLRNTF